MMTGGYTSPEPSGSSLKCDICYQVCWCSTREMSTRLNIRRCSADPYLKYIGWCTCLHPIILYPKIDGEFYPRCLDCGNFYEECDWKKRYERAVAKSEQHREESQRAGHPLYQPGAKYAPRMLPQIYETESQASVGAVGSHDGRHPSASSAELYSDGHTQSL